MYPTGFDNITIGTARWLASKNNLDGAVIIVFGGGTCKTVSYGKNRAKCQQLGRLIDDIGDQIESGRLDISEFTEPPLFAREPAR